MIRPQGAGIGLHGHLFSFLCIATIIMATLLYFYPIETTFVRSDYELLKEGYRVKRFFFNSRRKALTPIYLLMQVFFLFYYAFSCKKIVSHFTGYHTYLPSVFSRLFAWQHYIILNGTECNNFPEYNYGYLQKPILFWFSEQSLKWATKLLPVSGALVHTPYTYKETMYREQGYQAFYKKISTPFEIVFNGVSPDLFTLNTAYRNNKSFITVATGLGSADRRGIKGLDIILLLAELTPEYAYTLIGAEHNLKENFPKNVNIIEFVSQSELVKLYNDHAFYLQLSVSEGFGISVCEAMLCGCIPIVSDVGMLPEIAGNIGYVLSFKDVNLLKDLVETAIKEFDTAKMPTCRNHIMDHFSLEKRKTKLFSAIN